MASHDGAALTEAVYYILLSLLSPLHGYGIMQKVESMSGGRLRLAAGTLYGARCWKRDGFKRSPPSATAAKRNTSSPTRAEQCCVRRCAAWKSCCTMAAICWEVEDDEENIAQVVLGLGL